jgi:peptidoglycan/LPS O-acetylase OafA/YrhL
LLFQTATLLLATHFTKASSQAGLPSSGWTFLTNLLLIEPYAHTTRAMIVSWTLVHEFGFYLLVAAGFAFAAGSRTYLGWLTFGMLLAFTSLFGLPQPGFLILNYWPEFMFGVLVYLARLETHRGRFKVQKALLAVIVAFASLSLFASVPDYSRQFPLAAVFALLLFFMAPLDHSIVHSKPLHWLGFIGGFSYSLYLVHAPLLVREANLAKRLVNPASLSLLVIIAGMWLVTVGFAYLFYRVCEVPLERLRFSFRHKHPIHPATPAAAH